MNYRDQRNYENLAKRIYPGVGAYDIPQLEPVQFDREAARWQQKRQAEGCRDIKQKSRVANPAFCLRCLS
jgi:hypothetical protein